MALSGLHVVFSYATDDGNRIPTALLGRIMGSSTIVSGGVSSAAPIPGPEGDRPIAHLIASEAGYFAVGPSIANASADPRVYLPAGETLDIYVVSGDKIAWLTA